MPNFVSTALAGFAALVGLAAPAQAALVTYEFWAPAGTALRQDFNCGASQSCTPVISIFPVTGIAITVVVDTAAGMTQYGDPNGGAGQTYIGGGAGYGLPIGVSAAFSVAGPAPFSSGLLVANDASEIVADAGFATFQAISGTSTFTSDPQTFDQTSSFLSSGLTISMFDPGPLQLLGGEWLPGMSNLAFGTATFTWSSLLYRTAGGTGAVLENTAVYYEFTTSDLRYGTGPASVPEPGAIGLFGAGLLLAAAARRRRTA